MANRGSQPAAKRRDPLSYEPDYAVSPGKTLKETLDALHLSQSEFATRASLSLKHVNQILQGSASITLETALAFENVTRVPARFWTRLESNYREAKLRQEKPTLTREEREWVRKSPIKELVRRGAIEDRTDITAQFRELLRFFGVASYPAWKKVWLQPQASFRQSKAFRVDRYALASWLRLGELEALDIDCQPFDRARFKDALAEARGLTTVDPSEFVPRLVGLCAEAGVAVIFVPEIQGTRASGAARWLSPTKAVIQLSLRHKTDDHLWFSFFHESGHILLHGKKQVFIEIEGSKPDEEQEEDEANSFAASILIPPKFNEDLMRLRTLAEIRQLASEVGIAPGIVVGRLQKEDLLDYSRGNGLKRRFKFVEN